MTRQILQTESKKAQSGFTIAELLVVVVIIALLGGVGGGLYVGTYKKLLVEKAARGLVLTAQYARISAIEKQRPYEIQLDLANNGYAVTTTQYSEEAEGTEEIVVSDNYCKPVSFEEGVVFEDLQIAPTASEAEVVDDTEEQLGIVFQPNGTAQSAVIQIGNGKNRYTVVIDAATAKATMHFGLAEQVHVGTIDLDAQ